MVKSYILATAAALALGVCSMTFAYSGGADMGGAGLPVMMQFEASETTASPPTAPSLDTGSVADDDKPLQTSSTQRAAPKPARDEFQRYFDRHYRAHLVLDASARRFFEVE